MENRTSSMPPRHPSTSTTMTASSEAGPSTPNLTHRNEGHPPVGVRDSSTTPSPVSQTSGEERFTRGPPTPGVRLSRMMMGKMGNLPPPPGPPPLGPPPLPPAPGTAQQQPHVPTSGSRTSSLPPVTGAPSQTRVSILHHPNRPPPSAPPPTSALPPIPSVATAGPSAHRRQISIASSTSSGGSASRRRSTKGKSASLNGPPSPSLSTNSAHAPSISPRTSSLLSPQHASSSVMPDARRSRSPSQASLGQMPSTTASGAGADTTTNEATVPEAKRSSGRQPRTPSRHLLQSALDRAQQAVEMDKNNNVTGSLAAYRDAVAQLRSVMDRVGVDSATEGRRRQPSAKTEEEGRTLRGIHDAYVARIELLSSYETSNGDATLQRQNSVHSTEDRESQADRRPGGEVTPTRSSMDESAHVGIGNLMLSDPTSSFTTPDRHQAGPSTPPRIPPSPTPPTRGLPRPPSPTPKGLNINMPIGSAEGADTGISLQQALDRAADSARSSPILPPSQSQSQLGMGHPSTSPRTVIEDSSELTPSKKRALLRAKLAAGNMETLETTIDDDGVPGSASSRGHSRHTSNASSFSPMVRQAPSETGSRRSEDKGLPPLPHTAAPIEPMPTYTLSPRQSSLGSLMQPRADGLLVSPSTNSGRIAQRRLSRQVAQNSISSLTEVGSASVPFPTQGSGPGPGSPPQLHTPTARTRAKSQPGTRPDLFHNASESQTLPPLPAIQPKSSAQFVRRPSDQTHAKSNGLAPPHAIGSHVHDTPSATSPHSVTRSVSSSLISPVPEPQPSEVAHRPFHLLRLLQTSMDPHGSGAYLTGSIHVSPHIWQTAIHHRPGQKKDPLRLVAQDTKVRCMEALIINLEIVRATGIPLLDGPRELKYGAPLTHVPPPRGGDGVVKMAEEFSHALDGLEEEMDQTYKAMVKAGVQVNGWKGKKSSSSAKSWGSRFTRSMDKITHTKALDSSDKYVELLSHFCASIQAIDDHLLNFTGPCSPAYHYLPPRARSVLESKIVRAAEFTSAVVVPFVLDDFKLFFSRYLKGGVRYLED